MAKSDTFSCHVITPERIVLECDARSVSFPAHDGEMGVLFNRAPMVCKMGIGRLRVESGEGKKTLFVDGGFAQVVDNRLTILTQQAKAPAEIDETKAREALVEAKAMKITDDASYTARSDAIRRAEAQIKLAKS